ncbi:apical endosomal glycoprotein isoform X2 [Betta splendens]|uniref:Apical endosomal glycoprotein isoform X2 n=1 Tax=Betta splendens TaxID=158456 RepID=A0A6P7P5X8_BETSP|nr:apical endosomal glycoprotein isoform X2 [Betta splendens]
MFHWKCSALILLVLQWAAGSRADSCQAPERTCDFVCDCSNCNDEHNCGYSEKGFKCDFEEAGMCGWTDQSFSPYSWERHQRGDMLPDSGPSSDYTTGTATGWFMGVNAVKTESLSTAVLTSPELRQSSPTCRLHLRYFLWDSGQKGLGSTPLWATVLLQDFQQAIVWRPEATSVRSWREATIYLGRIPTTFQIRLYSERSEGQKGDVAIDQLEFLDCALPSPFPGECPQGMLSCKHGGCVEPRLICDGSDDCGDETDEKHCAGYKLCDFEENLCDWDLRSLSSLKWVRTSQENISMSDPLKGPGRDYSNNSASGHFLYVTVPDNGLKRDWASFQSPLLEPTNSSDPCKMVMYTHLFGPRSGGLTVLVADNNIYPVWERGQALGDVWVKAEVDIVTEFPFQIIIMAAIRDFTYGGIAIDNIMLSPECRPSSANASFPNFPKPPKHPCTEPDRLCDFNPDCANADDESKCGDFFYYQGSSGWTDSSIGSQGWLYKNSTYEEGYLYVADAPGQQLTEAQMRTPLLGPSGPACSLSFSFALIGTADHIGELSVRVIDSLLGMQPKLWEFSGKTQTTGGAWQHIALPVGFRKHRFQLAFEARAVNVDPDTMIKVKNVHFINCYSKYLPATPTGTVRFITIASAHKILPYVCFHLLPRNIFYLFFLSGLSCNFESGLCGWYQDHGDNFDWTMLDGTDHTIGTGKSLVVDMWSSSLRGMSGCLVSFPQLAGPAGYCLSFFYKLYGPNTGTLNVKLLSNHGYETVLWTRSGAHGNVWNEAHCPVPHQLTSFQLVFEAVRSGYDGQLAIDDVNFMAASCSAPRLCSFEDQTCAYSSSGKVQWFHCNGHAVTTTGPKKDHTLETELGFYMMTNTGANILPYGETAVLTSPVRQGTSKTECLYFWYQRGGVNPGSLTVYIKPVKGDRVKIFSDNLNQGHVWRHGNGDISSALVEWQLEFEVVGAGGIDSYIAVDDILLLAHPCETQGSKCSLERGMCSWSNTQNSQKDKLDWELTSAESEKHYPIPLEDHTLGTERGHFLFLPSSNRTAANQNAQLLGPHLPPTKGTCLRFWAYKPSSSDSQLKVWKFSVGHLNELLVVKHLDMLWRHFDVNITSTEEYQIVFEGIKGSSGFIALDDIEYTIGVNCADEVTDPVTTPPKQANTGGVIACVIIILLLTGTLIVLLIYYLRTREEAMASSSASSVVAFSNESYDSHLRVSYSDIIKASPETSHEANACGFYI